MRLVLAFGLLIALSASADAAKAQHAKPHAGQSHPVQPVAVAKGYTVPGWTDEQTRHWMDSFHGGTD